MSSYLEVINEESFQHCLLLQNLHLDFNEILVIPDNTFRGSPNLVGLFLNVNHIHQIADSAFTGTSINFLDLGNNLLTSINSAALLPINSTLTTLELINNRLMTINSDDFANARNIRILIISGNAFFTLPGNAFEPLTSLEFLAMSNCGLTTLNADWFVGLTNLQTLYVGNNRIGELQPNVLNPLTNLEELHIYSNELIELRRDSFGASLSSLILIFSIGNSINVVDPEIITAGENLNYLFLLNNLCSGLNFYGVSTNQDFVLENLERCISNFAVTPAISCAFTLTPENLYWCEMTVQNPVNFEFASIEGEHLAARADEDVLFVNINDQNTRVIPSVICSQFGNLER